MPRLIMYAKVNITMTEDVNEKYTQVCSISLFIQFQRLLPIFVSLLSKLKNIKQSRLRVLLYGMIYVLIPLEIL